MKEFRTKCKRYLNAIKFKWKRNHRISGVIRSNNNLYIEFIRPLREDDLNNGQRTVEEFVEYQRSCVFQVYQRCNQKYAISRLALTRESAQILHDVLLDYFERLNKPIKLDMKFENEKIEFEENGEFKVGTFDISISVNGRNDVTLKNLEK